MKNAPQPQPTLVYLFGPPAVGKMTVGQKLAQLTGFRLLHAHQVIDFITDYFPFGTRSFSRLASTLNDLWLEEAARRRMDLITTGGWRFNAPRDAALIRKRVQPYADVGGRVYFVELFAPLEVRLERNYSENRRQRKRTDWSTEEYLRSWDKRYRQDSGGAIPFDLPFLRIETENLTAEATAQRICDHFELRERR